jgi:drug/metabolite transporter (DMT)-like permease
VVLGAIVLTEPISWNLFVGTVIVLAGVAASDKRFARPSTRSRL